MTPIELSTRRRVTGLTSDEFARLFVSLQREVDGEAAHWSATDVESWELVGPPTAKNGYQESLTIGRTSQGGFLGSAPGGGLCQLANMIHWLVLNSPLEVTELHHHSDALFPDERRRVPFGTGTSVFYKNIDYQFRNTGSEPVQLLLWLTDPKHRERTGTAAPVADRDRPLRGAAFHKALPVSLPHRGGGPSFSTRGRALVPVQ